MTPATDTTATEAPAARSPLLDLPGAVAAGPDDPDHGVAAHYGDPLREQRAAERSAVLVDRSNRGVVTITGPDRLSWLHSITSQHLSGLAAGRGGEALVLSPHGHVEHHALLAEDGTTTWLDVEPGTTAGLFAYLDSMRFLLRVEPRDAGAEWAVLSVVGPDAVAATERALGGPVPAALAEPVVADAGDDGAPGGFAQDTLARGPYPVATLPGAGGAGRDVLARRMPYGLDLLVPRDALRETADRFAATGTALAGISAFEAARIAARRPRLGLDTDHRTIPHEVGWLFVAVHLTKGCYRGQETVARVHNLGRPPRRLVLAHLDGTTVAPGSPVSLDGRTVGFAGASAVHHELGPIALVMVKRTVPDDATLVVDDPEAGPVAAQLDPAG